MMKSFRPAVGASSHRVLLKPLLMAATGVMLGNVSSALANPTDLFGMGAREVGMGNAFTAIADDPFASYYNMGGLAQLKRTTISLGLQPGYMRLGNPDNCVGESGNFGCSETFYYRQAGVLTVQQKKYGYEAPHGMTLGAIVPILPKLNFGVATYLPLDIQYDENGKVTGAGARLARIQTIDPYVPDYILYQNRPQRFSAYSGLGFEIIPGLGVGVGIHAFATATMGMDFKGTMIATSLEQEDGTTYTSVNVAMNPTIVMDMGPRTSPVVGILWNLGTLAPSLSGLQLGAQYRGKLGLEAVATIDSDIGVEMTLGDEEPFTYGVEADNIVMTLVDHYTPRQLAMGVSGNFADRFRVSADVTWSNWDAFQVAVASLPNSLDLGLGIEAEVTNARDVSEAQELFRNTITPRLGMELRLGPVATQSKLKGIDLYVRGGGGFDPNPFGTQTGLTNMLNSDRVLASLGFGGTTHNPISREKDLPLSVDLALQYHYLIPTEHAKTDAAGSNPPDGYPVGGSYVSQGSVYQGAVTVQFGF